MQTLERLFSTTQKERMLAAIPQRVSCRAFSAEPSPADWAALAYAASRYTLPGARLLLMNCPEELFTGTLLNMGASRAAGPLPWWPLPPRWKTAASMPASPGKR